MLMAHTTVRRSAIWARERITKDRCQPSCGANTLLTLNPSGRRERPLGFGASVQSPCILGVSTTGVGDSYDRRNLRTLDRASNPPPKRSMVAGSGIVEVGWNAATVCVPPSMTEALPAVNAVASVLMTSTVDVVPGRILAESGGWKLNPMTDPAEFLSSVTGATDPGTKMPEPSK